MNRHTLENLVIFSVLYTNSWSNNNKKVYSQYIKEKSERYLGIDITAYPSITILDFATPLITSSSELCNLELCDILENLKDKIDLSKINDDSNIIKDGKGWRGRDNWYINGIDLNNTYLIFNELTKIDNDRYKRIIREYNIGFLLNE